MSILFDTIYKTHLPYVTRLSRKLARGDRDLVDDLAQEAWLALWEAPPARWLDVRYVRSVLTRAMHAWLHRERALQMVTLEVRSPRPVTTRRYPLDFPRSTPRPRVQVKVQPHPSRRRKAA